MTSQKNRISFSEWIEREGVDRLAAKLKINRFTILHWRAGRHDPRVDQMRQIKRLSRGEIDYAQIIDRDALTKKSVRA